MSHEQKHPILQKLEEYLKNTPKEQLDEDWLDILKNSDMEAYYEKKYKDALERAKKLQETCDSTAVVGWCEYLFPELKESKDERIRKELIEQVAYITPNNDELDDELNTLPTYQKRIDKYRAWLEKQGHMLSPDKVVEWLECKAFQGWAEEISIKQIVDKFKKDFGL